MPCTILSFHEELFSSNPPILLHEFVQFQRHPPEIRRKDLFISLSAINMFYLTDSYIGFTLKMESVSKNTRGVRQHCYKKKAATVRQNGRLFALCNIFSFNTSYLTDSCIGFTLKMESVTKSIVFGLKMIVKSGLEKFILKSLHSLFLLLNL